MLLVILMRAVLEQLNISQNLNVSVAVPSWRTGGLMLSW